MGSSSRLLLPKTELKIKEELTFQGFFSIRVLRNSLGELKQLRVLARKSEETL